MDRPCHGLHKLRRLMGPDGSERKIYFHCHECGNFLETQSLRESQRYLENSGDSSPDQAWKNVGSHEPVLGELKKRAGSHIQLYKLKVLLDGDLSCMVLDENQRHLVQKTIETIARQT